MSFGPPDNVLPDHAECNRQPARNLKGPLNRAALPDLSLPKAETGPLRSDSSNILPSPSCVLAQTPRSPACLPTRQGQQLDPAGFCLSAFLPFMNLWLFSESGFLAGTVGPNRFGLPEPQTVREPTATTSCYGVPCVDGLPDLSRAHGMVVLKISCAGVPKEHDRPTTKECSQAHSPTQKELTENEKISVRSAASETTPRPLGQLSLTPGPLIVSVARVAQLRIPHSNSGWMQKARVLAQNSLQSLRFDPGYTVRDLTRQLCCTPSICHGGLWKGDHLR